ncbi:MAG: phosphoglycerate dehydrogenase [Fusobacteriaceae bacterium]|jgi:D-3-phosphoglycerate dehydrogenase|nr:phosphoglycerate dehydrogenase [Fusobacteriaceae bacterium]
MFRYRCLNPISQLGLRLFTEKYRENAENADVILVRSAEMKDFPFDESLLAVARAGAGVNNIPVDRCSEAGIVVFNTPGANANGVKELVLSGLLLASRDILGGVRWALSEKDNPDLEKLTEKQKKNFAGYEIQDKKLGVIGLGAVGVLVANAAISLGMQVYGYDPYMSVDAAWNLNKSTTHVKDIHYIFTNCDFITVHVPLLPETKHLINKETIDLMKPGVVILNYARGPLVNSADMAEALRSGKVRKYLSDFPEAEILAEPNAIVTPHLGASTEESEDNCAMMAVREVMDFLENGNIKNSVNLPDCDMGVPTRDGRVSIVYKNVKNMISQFTGTLGDSGINIDNMLNKSKGNYAYCMFDLDSPAEADVIEKIKKIPGVFKVRVIK